MPEESNIVNLNCIGTLGSWEEQGDGCDVGKPGSPGPPNEIDSSTAAPQIDSLNRIFPNVPTDRDIKLLSGLFVVSIAKIEIILVGKLLLHEHGVTNR